MAARDHEGALELLRQAQTLTGSDIAIMRAEVEVITLAKLERFAEALAVTDRPEWQQGDGYTKLVRVTYRLALMAAASHAEQAQRLLEQLTARVLAAKLGASQNDQRALRYLHHLGQIAMHLGLPGLAADIWHAGLATTEQIIDVPLELAFLESLLDIEVIEDRDALARQRTALLRECLYATLLKARNIAVDPSAAADPAFATLLSALHEAAEHPWREAHGYEGPWDIATTAAVAVSS
jgi:hypothetical protein